MSDQPKTVPAAGEADLPMMAETGAAHLDMNNDPDAEMVVVDKTKPADFKDEDDDDVDATALAAALEEGQYGDDDIIPVEGDALNEAEDEAEEAGALEDEAAGDAVPDRSVATYSGHDDAVYCVAVSPANPAIIATGSGDDSAHLVDLSDPAAPQTLLRLAELSDSVSAVAFSPDGELLAVGVMDGAVHVIDVAARAVLCELSVYGDLECLAWHPAPGEQGPTLAAGNADGSVYVWDVVNGIERTVLVAASKGGSGAVRSLFFPPGAPGFLLTGSEAGHSTLWDLARGKAVAALKNKQDVHEGGVICFAQHPSQSVLVTAGQDGSVHVASLAAAAGKLAVVARLKDAHRDSVEALAFCTAAGQPLLATASTDCTVKVWDGARNWQLRQTLQHEGGVVAAAWVPGAPVLVTASADGSVRAWDGRDGKLLVQLTGHTNAIVAMAATAAASAGSFRVVTGSDDNTAKVFDVAAAIAAAATATKQ